MLVPDVQDNNEIEKVAFQDKMLPENLLPYYRQHNTRTRPRIPALGGVVDSASLKSDSQTSDVIIEGWRLQKENSLTFNSLQ